MFLRLVRSSEAQIKSGSSLPISTSFFLALLFRSTAFVMSTSIASAMSAGPAVARSRIVKIPASFSFVFVAGPTPARAVTIISSFSSSTSSVSASTKMISNDLPRA